MQLEAASDAVGAFGFVRIEDGEFSPNAKRELWFDTTGDQQDRNEADPHTNEPGGQPVNVEDGQLLMLRP